MANKLKALPASVFKSFGDLPKDELIQVIKTEERMRHVRELVQGTEPRHDQEAGEQDRVVHPGRLCV
jgi:hypothetical protein